MSILLYLLVPIIICSIPFIFLSECRLICADIDDLSQAFKLPHPFHPFCINNRET